MRLFVVVILSCQILFGSCQQLYSTLSCILSRSNDDIHELANVTDKDSIESKINFRMYTKTYPDGKDLIFKDEQSLKESGFEPSFPTRIITHGFNGRGVDDACMGPMKALLSNERFNVIIMDWYRYQSLNYYDAVRKVKPTALHLLQMITFFIENGMNVSTTALIAHSLGAHVMGVAGYNSKYEIYHIVGIDPAEPSFRNKVPGERLSREDATHVEVIHTNGGHCGMKEAIGHYDFYVNGGSEQPSCNKNSCSHGRSNSYYTESISSSTGFYGRLCNDSENIEKDKCTGKLGLMGGLFRSYIRPGIFYVETNSESPFAKGYPDAR